MRYELIKSGNKEEGDIIIEFGSDETNLKLKIAIISILEALIHSQDVYMEEISKLVEKGHKTPSQINRAYSTKEEIKNENQNNSNGITGGYGQDL